jgi:DNA-binding transcriptional LysR family regulator
LVSVPEEAAPDVELYPLHAEAIVFACPDSHHLAGRKRVSLAEVADEPFIDFPEGWGNRTTVDAAFATSGLHRTVHTEVVTFTMATELVREGLGVAFLPESALQRGQGTGIRAIHTPLVWRIQLAHSAVRRATAADRVVIGEFRRVTTGAPLQVQQLHSE